MDSNLERYSRQILFQGIGEEGQKRLCASKVLVCGCGALGSSLAEMLTRAGVGELRIVDRDFVEMSNLQRQVLFDEDDVSQQLPKAVAAARKLERINSQVVLEPIVADIDPSNILKLFEGRDLVVDGTDNFEVRFLINDASLETGIPWIYGGCIGSHGQTMTIFPGETACLRCLIDTVPDPGSTETCDTAGIISPAVTMVTSLQVADALKILTGHREQVADNLRIVDVWDSSFRTMSLKDLRERAQCPACIGGERAWLQGTKGSQTTTLCGRNAVQISPAARAELNLEDVAAKMSGAGTITRNPYLLRLVLSESPYELNLFRDGRAIIKGTSDASVARGLYARYIGH